MRQYELQETSNKEQEMKKWQTLSSKRVMDNQWLRVRRDTVKLADGTILDDYFVVESFQVAMVVALTPEGKILMVKQYKHGVGEVMTELPAGYVEPKENLEVAARRELLEETGYQAKELNYLGKLGLQVTRSDEVVFVYAAIGLEKIKEQHLDVSEAIEVMAWSPEEVETKIKQGDVWGSSTVAAYYLWKMKRSTSI